MKKRLLALIGFSLLSIMVLAGCNNKVQNPPPPADNNGVSIIMTAMVSITIMVYGDGHNDINTNNDGNPAVDQNTPREDIIEDKD